MISIYNLITNLSELAWHRVWYIKYLSRVVKLAMRIIDHDDDCVGEIMRETRKLLGWYILVSTF